MKGKDHKVYETVPPTRPVCAATVGPLARASELSSLAELRDQEANPLSFPGFKQLDDVWMVQNLENFQLFYNTVVCGFPSPCLLLFKKLLPGSKPHELGEQHPQKYAKDSSHKMESNL